MAEAPEEPFGPGTHPWLGVLVLTEVRVGLDEREDRLAEGQKRPQERRPVVLGELFAKRLHRLVEPPRPGPGELVHGPEQLRREVIALRDEADAAVCPLNGLGVL